MSTYRVPSIAKPKLLADNEIALVASGDGRLAPNQAGWAAQSDMEAKIAAAFAAEGYKIVRANDVDPVEGHAFISSQKMGMEVFKTIDPNAKLIVAESVWQYSHHLLAGLRSHRGPILTIANWSGQWPGLVGLLNLNGCLTKMGVEYSTLWSLNFDDEYFLSGIREWLRTGKITHDTSHVRPFKAKAQAGPEAELGAALADQMKTEKAILGVFDEGCMGMYNAIVDDELMNSMGIYKERLSQSTLVAEMAEVGEDEARGVYQWLLDRGMTFNLGSDGKSELTESQVIEQCKMYVAALRLAHQNRCDGIGIQYQLGLIRSVPASDLVEGLLNNPDRPPVNWNGEVLYAGRALPHFNEVDECAGIDSLVTDRVWTAMGMDPSNTLHDLRYGEDYNGQFVWVFLISGAAPASHFIGGYSGASSDRQPPVYFQQGGGTLKGISKPGVVVWSRIYTSEGALHCDMGLCDVVELPAEETNRRWQATTPQWPIMHAVLRGITRDQMMARHKANHIQVVYADSEEMAGKALVAKACMLEELGVHVHLCGNV